MARWPHFVYGWRSTPFLLVDMDLTLVEIYPGVKQIQQQVVGCILVAIVPPLRHMWHVEFRAGTANSLLLEHQQSAASLGACERAVPGLGCVAWL